jgi:hypothetical protein
MPAGEPLNASGSLVAKALAWDVAGTQRILQSGDFTATQLQHAIFGCVLKATGSPGWHGALLWVCKPYELLLQQLAWSCTHPPAPSDQQLRMVQLLVQYVTPTAYQGVEDAAQAMAAASGCGPLLRVLLGLPPASVTAADAGILQDWEGASASEPPLLAYVCSRSDSGFEMVVPQAVRWPGQARPPADEARVFKFPGPLEMAAASGSVEAVYAIMDVGWPCEGAAGGMEAVNRYAGLEPIHWAAAVSWAL